MISNISIIYLKIVATTVVKLVKLNLRHLKNIFLGEKKNNQIYNLLKYFGKNGCVSQDHRI